MNPKRFRPWCLAAAAVLTAASAGAKLPPPSDEAKAKAAEAAAKAAWAGKVDGYQLCKTMDRVAATYRAEAKKAGKDAQAGGGHAALRRSGPLRLHAAGPRAGCGRACGARSRRRPAAHAAACRPCLNPAARRPANQAGGWQAVAGAPRLTQARCELLREIRILDEYGEQRSIHIPAERPLTVFVDKRELVTLMTLGAAPRAAGAGLPAQPAADRVGAGGRVDHRRLGRRCRRRAHPRAASHDIAAKTARRVVTTGCGQGTVFGDVMAQLHAVQLPDAPARASARARCSGMLETMRQQDSIHRKAGSVHGCALFRGAEMLMFVEDVGRHNAIDTIAGWMGMHDVVGADKVFYTTGRLTSEMVMKSAQIGVPIIVSRNGVTAMGHELATRLGMTLFGRAANRHFLCYTGTERFDSEPEPQRAAVRVVAG